MRVISGKYRGRKLAPPKNDDVRPTADVVKEAIFNILQGEADGARVLDLFCGSGALGIEAVSRGAEYVVFADASPESLDLTRRNLTGMDYKGKLLRADFKQTLSTVPPPFDIIFLDPPYAGGMGGKAVRMILERGVLADGGVIIWERAARLPRGQEEEPLPVEEFKLSVDTRRYGKTEVLLIRQSDPDADDTENLNESETDYDDANTEESEGVDEIETDYDDANTEETDTRDTYVIEPFYADADAEETETDAPDTEAVDETKDANEIDIEAIDDMLSLEDIELPFKIRIPRCRCGGQYCHVCGRRIRGNGAKAAYRTHIRRKRV
ncbi:MAG: 16S rRNA (guanine(966)-N(2))-methyltransferase RsmD [Clostridiaceae bacterium]|jgi:16S rRNA (guanine966-N2)-methyltransferase|nr:16S rRNA (guanine(966)-N(2))-methyltransferase RsmD [Clostridiaceae bacterium]